MPNDKLKQFYDIYKDPLNLPDYDRFKSTLSNDIKRSEFHRIYKEPLNLPDYDRFSSTLGFTQSDAPLDQPTEAPLEQPTPAQPTEDLPVFGPTSVTEISTKEETLLEQRSRAIIDNLPQLVDPETGGVLLGEKFGEEGQQIQTEFEESYLNKRVTTLKESPEALRDFNRYFGEIFENRDIQMKDNVMTEVMMSLSDKDSPELAAKLKEMEELLPMLSLYENTRMQEGKLEYRRFYDRYNDLAGSILDEAQSRVYQNRIAKQNRLDAIPLSDRTTFLESVGELQIPEILNEHIDQLFVVGEQTKPHTAVDLPKEITPELVDLVKSFASTDEGIEFFHSLESGGTAARNIALDVASMRFKAMFRSDEKMQHNVLEAALRWHQSKVTKDLQTIDARFKRREGEYQELKTALSNAQEAEDYTNKMLELGFTLNQEYDEDGNVISGQWALTDADLPEEDVIKMVEKAKELEAEYLGNFEEARANLTNFFSEVGIDQLEQYGYTQELIDEYMPSRSRLMRHVGMPIQSWQLGSRSAAEAFRTQSEGWNMFMNAVNTASHALLSPVKEAANIAAATLGLGEIFEEKTLNVIPTGVTDPNSLAYDRSIANAMSFHDRQMSLGKSYTKWEDDWGEGWDWAVNAGSFAAGSFFEQMPNLGTAMVAAGVGGAAAGPIGAYGAPYLLFEATYGGHLVTKGIQEGIDPHVIRDAVEWNARMSSAASIVVPATVMRGFMGAFGTPYLKRAALSNLAVAGISTASESGAEVIAESFNIFAEEMMGLEVSEQEKRDRLAQTAVVAGLSMGPTSTMAAFNMPRKGVNTLIDEYVNNLEIIGDEYVNHAMLDVLIERLASARDNMTPAQKGALDFITNQKVTSDKKKTNKELKDTERKIAEYAVDAKLGKYDDALYDELVLKSENGILTYDEGLQLTAMSFNSPAKVDAAVNRYKDKLLQEAGFDIGKGTPLLGRTDTEWGGQIAEITDVKDGKYKIKINDVPVEGDFGLEFLSKNFSRFDKEGEIALAKEMKKGMRFHRVVFWGGDVVVEEQTDRGFVPIDQESDIAKQLKKDADSEYKRWEHGEVYYPINVGEAAQEAVVQEDAVQEVTEEAQEVPSVVAEEAAVEETEIKAKVEEEGGGQEQLIDLADKSTKGTGVTVTTMSVSDIGLDPKRFQYKLDTDSKSGVSDKLQDVRKFDKKKAGVISVWLDPSDGKYYVINGHHRLELAQRLGEDTINVMVIEASNASEARYIGAMQNISEGMGTAVDAAKLLRESGINSMSDAESLMQSEGLSATDSKLQKAVALANLSDYLFDGVIDKKVPENVGVIIGRYIDGHSVQDQFFNEQVRGKSVSQKHIEIMAQDVQAAPRAQVTTLSLFGETTEEVSNYQSRVRLVAEIRRKLSKMKNLLAKVSGDKDLLEEYGNIINAHRSEGVSKDAAVAMAVFDALRHKVGPIKNVIDKAIDRYEQGESIQKVANEAAREITEASDEILKGRGKASTEVGRRKQEEAAVEETPQAVESEAVGDQVVHEESAVRGSVDMRVVSRDGELVAEYRKGKKGEWVPYTNQDGAKARELKSKVEGTTEGIVEGVTEQPSKKGDVDIKAKQELDADKLNKEAGVDIYVARQEFESGGNKYYLSQIKENNSTNTFLIEDANGNEIAKAQLSEDGFINNITIDVKHRREGFTSKLYDFIELRKGIEFNPSPTEQTSKKGDVESTAKEQTVTDIVSDTVEKTPPKVEGSGTLAQMKSNLEALDFSGLPEGPALFVLNRQALEAIRDAAIKVIEALEAAQETYTSASDFAAKVYKEVKGTLKGVPAAKAKREIEILLYNQAEYMEARKASAVKVTAKENLQQLKDSLKGKSVIQGNFTNRNYHDAAFDLYMMDEADFTVEEYIAVKLFLSRYDRDVKTIKTRRDLSNYGLLKGLSYVQLKAEVGNKVTEFNLEGQEYKALQGDAKIKGNKKNFATQTLRDKTLTNFINQSLGQGQEGLAKSIAVRSATVAASNEMAKDYFNFLRNKGLSTEEVVVEVLDSLKDEWRQIFSVGEQGISGTLFSALLLRAKDTVSNELRINPDNDALINLERDINILLAKVTKKTGQVNQIMPGIPTEVAMVQGWKQEIQEIFERDSGANPTVKAEFNEILDAIRESVPESNREIVEAIKANPNLLNQLVKISGLQENLVESKGKSGLKESPKLKGAVTQAAGWKILKQGRKQFREALGMAPMGFSPKLVQAVYNILLGHLILAIGKAQALLEAANSTKADLAEAGMAQADINKIVDQVLNDNKSDWKDIMSKRDDAIVEGLLKSENLATKSVVSRLLNIRGLKGVTPQEKLLYYLNNKNKFEEAIHDLVGEVLNDINLSEAQRRERINALNSLKEELTDEVLSRTVSAASKESTGKTLHQQIIDLTVDYYNRDQKAVKFYDSLAAEMVSKLGLTAEGAEAVEAVIKDFLDRKLKSTLQDRLRNKLQPKEKKAPRVRDTRLEKLAKLIIDGALDDQTLAAIVGEEFGFRQLTSQEASEIEILARRVVDANEGSAKVRANMELASWLFHKKDRPAISKFMSLFRDLYYTSILSGFLTTTYRNVLGPFIFSSENVILDFISDAVIRRDPTTLKALRYIFTSPLSFKAGFSLFPDVMLKGYSSVIYAETPAQDARYIDDFVNNVKSYLAKGFGYDVKWTGRGLKLEKVEKSSEDSRYKDMAKGMIGLMSIVPVLGVRLNMLNDNLTNSVMIEYESYKIAYDMAQKGEYKATGDLMKDLNTLLALDRVGDIDTQIDNEIAQLKADKKFKSSVIRLGSKAIDLGILSGLDYSPSLYRNVRRKELILEFRNQQLKEMAITAAKETTLLNAPSGMASGRIYQWYKGVLNTPNPYSQALYSLPLTVFFPIVRVPLNLLNRAYQWSPFYAMEMIARAGIGPVTHTAGTAFGVDKWQTRTNVTSDNITKLVKGTNLFDKSGNLYVIDKVTDDTISLAVHGETKVYQKSDLSEINDLQLFQPKGKGIDYWSNQASIQHTVGEIVDLREQYHEAVREGNKQRADRLNTKINERNIALEEHRAKEIELSQGNFNQVYRAGGIPGQREIAGWYGLPKHQVERRMMMPILGTLAYALMSSFLFDWGEDDEGKYVKNRVNFRFTGAGTFGDPYAMGAGYQNMSVQWKLPGDETWRTINYQDSPFAVSIFASFANMSDQIIQGDGEIRLKDGDVENFAAHHLTNLSFFYRTVPELTFMQGMKSLLDLFDANTGAYQKPLADIDGESSTVPGFSEKLYKVGSRAAGTVMPWNANAYNHVYALLNDYRGYPETRRNFQGFTENIAGNLGVFLNLTDPSHRYTSLGGEMPYGVTKPYDFNPLSPQQLSFLEALRGINDAHRLIYGSGVDAQLTTNRRLYDRNLSNRSIGKAINLLNRHSDLDIPLQYKVGETPDMERLGNEYWRELINQDVQLSYEPLPVDSNEYLPSTVDLVALSAKIKAEVGILGESLDDISLGGNLPMSLLISMARGEVVDTDRMQEVLKGVDVEQLNYELAKFYSENEQIVNRAIKERASRLRALATNRGMHRYVAERTTDDKINRINRKVRAAKDETQVRDIIMQSLSLGKIDNIDGSTRLINAMKSELGINNPYNSFVTLSDEDISRIAELGYIDDDAREILVNDFVNLLIKARDLRSDLRRRL